jgi:sodium transport system permease protein
MRIVFTVFRKELIDSLRDRRTLIAMLAMPLVLLPLLMGVVAKTQSVQQEKAAERILNVGLRTQGNAAAFRSLLEGRGDILLERGKIRIFDGLAVDQGRALVESDSLDAFISFDPAFDRQVEHLLPGKVALYYKGSKADRSESERLLTLLRAFADDLHTARFRQLGLDPLVAQAVAIDERNLASDSALFIYYF